MHVLAQVLRQSSSPTAFTTARARAIVPAAGLVTVGFGAWGRHRHIAQELAKAAAFEAARLGIVHLGAEAERVELLGVQYRVANALVLGLGSFGWEALLAGRALCRRRRRRARMALVAGGAPAAAGPGALAGSFFVVLQQGADELDEFLALAPPGSHPEW